MTEPRYVQLPDGRRLAYSEYGDLRGKPLINCHGGLTSRRDVEGCEAIARDVGARVISPDRPGIGRSDRRPGRTLLDWPADVGALADALEVEEFAVMGWSLGGQYAAACAFALPERVRSVALVASPIPREWSGMIHEINRMDRALMRISRRAPWLDDLIFRGMGAVARRAPSTFRRLSSRTLDEPSRRLVNAAPAPAFSGPIAEGVRGPGGVVDDYRVLDSPWGFDPAQIQQPVQIWQGDADGLVPAVWAQRLAKCIPHSNLRMCPGEGHFLPLAHYREILSGVLDKL